eukprot:jgi/Chrpa1/23563/Chrysochromulina_OHIO_Genome00022799-RA
MANTSASVILNTSATVAGGAAALGGEDGACAGRAERLFGLPGGGGSFRGWRGGDEGRGGLVAMAAAGIAASHFSTARSP